MDILTDGGQAAGGSRIAMNEASSQLDSVEASDSRVAVECPHSGLSNSTLTPLLSLGWLRRMLTRNADPQTRRKLDHGCSQMGLAGRSVIRAQTPGESASSGVGRAPIL